MNSMSEVPDCNNIYKNDLILIIENRSSSFSFINYLKSNNNNNLIKENNSNDEFFIFNNNEKNYLINNNPFEINTGVNNSLEEYLKKYGIIIFFYDSNDKNYFELIKIFINNNYSSIKGFNSPLILMIENKEEEINEKESYINLIIDNDNINKDKMFLINKLFCYYYESYLNIEDDKKYKIKIFNTIIENYPIIKIFKNSNCNMIYPSLQKDNEYNLDITLIGKTSKIDSLLNYLNKKNEPSFDLEDCFPLKLNNIEKKLKLLIHKINLEEIIKEEEIINLETHGIIYIYDLDDEESFEYIKKYINIMLSSLGNMPFLIVGIFSDKSNYSTYSSKEKSLHKCLLKKTNIISYIMDLKEIYKENNLFFNDFIISLVDQIFNKYPIYNYDEFNKPELYLNPLANSTISENRENYNYKSRKILEEYTNEKMKIFSCPNCLNPYYVNFNESLGLIIFNCLKCKTIPECFNLNYIKDNLNSLNEFNKFYNTQKYSFINYKNYFFDENNKLYNYFCIDCQQQVFTGTNKNHFTHEGKCYNNYEFKKLIAMKKEEFEKEEKYLKEIKEKFKKFMSDLEDKFNLIYNTKKKINEIKKDMITSFEIIRNNYILYQNFKNLKFKKPKKMEFQENDEPEDKIKKIFEYMIDSKSQEIYNKYIIKNVNINYYKDKKKNNENNIINNEKVKTKIKDICSFKYKNKEYICLSMDNDILDIYDEKMKHITELDLSSKIQCINSLYSIYNYSKENNNIYISGLNGIKKITINNKINSITELNNIKIFDEYREKGINFENYIKLDKDYSITSTENKKIFLLINDDKKINKKDLTKDILKNKQYENIISLDKINNNTFSIKFENIFEEPDSIKEKENKAEFINISFADLFEENPKIHKIKKNIITCTHLIELYSEEKLNVIIKKNFIFPDNYHILGKLNDNNILIQCNNPFLQRELILFDINNFTYTKKYKYNTSFFNKDILHMIPNNQSENIINYILFNNNLNMKVNYYLPKEQEILIFNQNLHLCVKNDKKDERVNTKIDKIIKINNRFFGIRENMKNENQLFMIDIV